MPSLTAARNGSVHRGGFLRLCGPEGVGRSRQSSGARLASLDKRSCQRVVALCHSNPPASSRRHARVARGSQEHLGGERHRLSGTVRGYSQAGRPANLRWLPSVRDPLAPVKMRVNLIVKALDNNILGNHINRMPYAVGFVSVPRRLLASDRPVQLFRLNEPDGLISMPASPTKLFVAANQSSTFDKLRRTEAHKVVCEVNKFVVSRARQFVWANDQSQERFVENRMSTAMESTPLFPNVGRYLAAAARYPAREFARAPQLRFLARIVPRRRYKTMSASCTTYVRLQRHQ